MEKIKYLLAKLAEEAAEVAQEALKAHTFGIDSNYNGSGNADRLNYEMNDLLAVFEVLKAEIEDSDLEVSLDYDYDLQAAKVQKLDFYWRMVNDEDN